MPAFIHPLRRQGVSQAMLCSGRLAASARAHACAIERVRDSVVFALGEVWARRVM